MAETVLNVNKREESGKKISKQLRRDGRIPGIYYIHGEDSVALSVDEKELKNIIHSDASIIDLKFEDDKALKSVIRDVQWDPVYGKPVHVDFMGVKLTEKVHVTLPVHLAGTPVGVKQEGGILQHIIREIDIECLPLDIPEHFEVDVSDLDIGGAIRIEDLKIDKVTILNDPLQSIVTVRPPAVIEETTAEEEVLDEGGEPEVVGEKKDEAEGGGEDSQAGKKE